MALLNSPGMGWAHEPFVVPEEIYAGWNAEDKGTSAEAQWNEKLMAMIVVMRRGVVVADTRLAPAPGCRKHHSEN